MFPDLFHFFPPTDPDSFGHTSLIQLERYRRRNPQTIDQELVTIAKQLDALASNSPNSPNSPNPSFLMVSKLIQCTFESPNRHQTNQIGTTMPRLTAGIPLASTAISTTTTPTSADIFGLISQPQQSNEIEQFISTQRKVQTKYPLNQNRQGLFTDRFDPRHLVMSAGRDGTIAIWDIFRH